MKAHGHRGDVPRVEALLRQMVAAELEISVDTYNAVIHACAQAKDILRAEAYVTEMETAGLRPNLVTYNSVINACACLGDASRAEKWLRNMISTGIQPNYVTYGTICKVFARQGGIDQVVNIMMLLEDNGTQLNEYFFAVLIAACGTADPPDVERAERALLDLVCRGLQPKRVKRVLARVVGERRATELFRALRMLAPASGGAGAGPGRCCGSPGRGGRHQAAAAAQGATGTRRGRGGGRGSNGQHRGQCCDRGNQSANRATSAVAALDRLPSEASDIAFSETRDAAAVGRDLGGSQGSGCGVNTGVLHGPLREPRYIPGVALLRAAASQDATMPDSSEFF